MHSIFIYIEFLNSPFYLDVMKIQRIKKFGVTQTAKVVAMIYFIMIAILFLPFTFISYATGLIDNFGPFPGVIFFIAPVFYGVVAFVATAIGCLIYNALAARIGGIEIEIETTDPL